MSSRLLTASGVVQPRYAASVALVARRQCSSRPDDRSEDKLRKVLGHISAKFGKELEFDYSSLGIEKDVVYGARPCMAVLSARQRPVRKIYVADYVGNPHLDFPPLLKPILLGVQRLFPAKWKQIVCPVPERVLIKLLKQRGISPSSNHEGIVMDVAPLFARNSLGDSMDELPSQSPSGSGTPPIILACPSTHDMVDFGRLMRIARYYNVRKVIVSSTFVDKTPITSLASAQSQGSVDYVEKVPLKRNLPVCMKAWSVAGFRVVGAVESNVRGAIPHRELKHDGRPVVLVLPGNETPDARKVVLGNCKELVTVSSPEPCQPDLNVENLSDDSPLRLAGLPRASMDISDTAAILLQGLAPQSPPRTTAT